MSPLPTRIEFSGPFAVVSGANATPIFGNEVAERGGIYIWLLPSGNSYLPTYVGKASNRVADRIEDELQGFLSGRDHIRRVGKAPGDKDLYAWYPGRGKVVEFFNRIDEMHGFLCQLLPALRVVVAPLDVKDQDLKRIETGLIQFIKSQPEGWKDFLENTGRSVRSPDSLEKLEIVFPVDVRPFQGSILV
jgi:hypothetical protein